MVNWRHTLIASPCLLKLLRTPQHSVQLHLLMPAKEALLLYTNIAMALLSAQASLHALALAFAIALVPVHEALAHQACQLWKLGLPFGDLAQLLHILHTATTQALGLESRI